MDWLQRMNAAIDYIEDNITGNIDYKQIAKIACCPNCHFQRMFAFIAEISLSEYIRRRRLTLAAFDLQQGNKSIIEIAQKYSYESHSSFTRAFNKLHGIAPKAARKSGAKLKAYPRMFFRISITGGGEMSYRIENTDTFSAVGIKHCVNTEKAISLVPTIWEEARQNGTANKLLDLLHNSLEKVSCGVLGILSDGGWGNNTEFSYYTAVLSEKDTPEDMEKIIFPKTQWAVFEAPTLADIAKTWKRLYTDWVPTSGYSLANLPAIECYYPPGHKPQNELWIPIIKE